MGPKACFVDGRIQVAQLLDQESHLRRLICNRQVGGEGCEQLWLLLPQQAVELRIDSLRLTRGVTGWRSRAPAGVVLEHGVAARSRERDLVAELFRQAHLWQTRGLPRHLRTPPLGRLFCLEFGLD